MFDFSSKSSIVQPSLVIGVALEVCLSIVQM